MFFPNLYYYDKSCAPTGRRGLSQSSSLSWVNVMTKGATHSVMSHQNKSMQHAQMKRVTCFFYNYYYNYYYISRTQRTVPEFNTVLGQCVDRESNTFGDVPPKQNKNPQRKKSLGQGGGGGGGQRGRTQKVHVQSREPGHRVGGVGHPDWNEPNGTENVSSSWTRPSPTFAPQTSIK